VDNRSNDGRRAESSPTSLKLQASYNRLSLEEQRNLFFKDPTTGLLNERAFSMLPRDACRPMVAVVEGERASAVLTAAKEADELAEPPRRARRGERPFGSPVELPTELGLQENRLPSQVPSSLVAAHDAMSREERFAAVHVEPGTGILTGEG
jgi:hypothetical protein